MTFYSVLTRLAAQILLGLAVFLWGVIALLDVERTQYRLWFVIGFASAAIALVGLSRNWRGTSWLGAFGLFFPIGVLAHGNGASPWLWLFWLICAVLTERWIRDGVQPGIPEGGGKPQ